MTTLDLRGTGGTLRLSKNGGSGTVRSFVAVGPAGPASTIPGPAGATGPQGPQGLPGPSSVPADNAVAGFVTGPSATQTALAASFAPKGGTVDLATLIPNPATETDAGAKIQQAIDGLASFGGGTVKVTIPGTYLSGVRQDPAGGPYGAMFWLRSNTRLESAGGVVYKLKDNTVAPAGITQLHLVSTYGPYRYNPATTQKNISVVGGTIDGNGNNQTLDTSSVPRVAHGLFFGEVTNGYVENVKVTGLKGTMGSPPGETMHFECNNSNGVRYVGCEVDGSTSTQTATGFSSDNSHDVVYTGCTAHDLINGMGFTQWQSSGNRYIGCRAYRSGFAGFNVELSRDSVYSACISGGIAPDQSRTNSSTNPFFTTNAQTLGQTRGWQLLGSDGITLIGCSATYNGRNLYLANEVTAGLDLGNTRIRAIACDFRYATEGQDRDLSVNGAQDLFLESCYHYLSSTVARETKSGVTTTTPTIDYVSLSGTGATGFFFLGHTRTVAAWAAQWYYTRGSSAVASVGINGIGQWVTKGIARARAAKTADYTVTDQDHIIAVTSTAAARTITLPAVSSVAPGTEIIVRDESGAAAANRITVVPTGADTIQGFASNVIATNYGELRFYSDGAAKWLSTPAAGIGNGQPGVLSPSSAGWSPAGVTVTANRAYISRFVAHRTMNITSLSVAVSGAATVDDAVDVGIFDASLNRLASSGATTGKVNSTGAKTVTLSAPVTLHPGVTYYAAISYGAIGGTGATLRGANFSDATAVQLFGSTAGLAEAFRKDASHPLPASIVSPTVDALPVVLGVRE